VRCDPLAAASRSAFAARVLLSLLLSGVVVQSWAQTQPSPVLYRIGPKDLVEIKVFEVPDLNVSVRVSDEGTILLPLIGAVAVEGLSEGEAAERLRALLEAKYVQRASVTVQVREFRSRPLVVMGAVRSPGYLSVAGRFTLLEALTASGGLTDQSGGTVLVLRRAENGLSDQVSISTDDLTVRADPDANIPIFANDLINVMAAVPVTVFFLGEAAHVGAVEFKSNDRISLLTAVARAGGLSDRASRMLRIKRREAGGREVELEVNYKRILSGKDPDIPLQNGDLIIVKESIL
jgi:polysaccharide biosynthesis/export protein